MYQFLVLTLFFAICIIAETYCDDEKDNLLFKYDGMEQQESIKDYFNIAFDEINKKEGSNSIFIINGNVEQKLDLDDEWKAQVTVYRSDTADGQYSEYMKFPKIGVCAFMKTIYKKYFHASMKDCSNLPSPDTCPLTKEKYFAKCEFDANVFRHVSKPGFYMIKANLLNNDEVKTGIIVRGSVSEK